MQCSFCYRLRPAGSDCINKSIIRTITPPALAFALALRHSPAMALRANEQSPCPPPDLCSQNAASKASKVLSAAKTLASKASKAPRPTFARLLARPAAAKRPRPHPLLASSGRKIDVGRMADGHLLKRA